MRCASRTSTSAPNSGIVKPIVFPPYPSDGLPTSAARAWALPRASRGPLTARDRIRVTPRYVAWMEARRDGYLISDDPGRLDLDATWGYLRTSYWARNIPRETVARSIEGSLVAGLYEEGGRQVGFARAVTDRATFAWIGDVFVVEAHRGRGLGVWLVETLLAHPDLAGLRLLVLATADAHGLYRRFGFEPIDAETFMSLRRSLDEIYGG